MMAEYNPFDEGPEITDLDDAPTFSRSKIEIRSSTEQSQYTTEMPLYFDNGLLIPQETHLGDPLNTDQPGPSTSRDFQDIYENQSRRIISTQPTSSEEDNLGHRKIIPVYTMGWKSTPHSQFLPLSGLDFLTGVEQVQINETVQDLHNRSLISNRYTVKVPYGETLYVAQESSTEMQKTCCGNHRSFTLTLHDPSKQEAATFVRNLACSLGCFGCCLQEMDVYLPQGEYLGRIQQEISLIGTSYYVKDGFNVLYRLEGPNTLPCLMVKNATFNVYSGDGQTKLGNVTRTWDQQAGDYNMVINFPAPGTPERHKVLLIAATFLLEYVYFEDKKKCFCGIC